VLSAPPNCAKTKELAKQFADLEPSDQAWKLRELAEEVTGCRETAELVYEALQPWLESL
jgi:hypothetical protein